MRKMEEQSKEQLEVKLKALYRVQHEICMEIEEARTQLAELEYIQDRRTRMELTDILVAELEDCRERLIKADKGVKQVQVILLTA